MTVKNRGWVKNAAIVFFAALSVLTFFSNTILNYSLPEVAGSYAYSGTISSAIRGQGTVTANQSYSVQIGETRQIKSVLVKTGERVEAGQVLFLLEETESQELQDALKALDSMNIALTKKLLQMNPSDYDQENRAIELLQREIEELEAQKLESAEHKLLLDNAKQAIKAAQLVLDARKDEKAAIQEKITAMASSDDFDYLPLLTAEVTKRYEEIEAAKLEEKAAQKRLDTAEEMLDNGGNSSVVSGLKSAATAKLSEITSLKAQKQEYAETALEAMERVYGDGSSLPAGSFKTTYENYLADGKAADANALLTSSQHTDTSITSALASFRGMDPAIQKAQDELSRIDVEIADAQDVGSSEQQLKNNVSIAKKKLETAKEATASAQKAYDSAFKTLTNTFKTELKAKELEEKAAQAALDDAKAVQTELEQKTIKTPDEINSSIKQKQLEIENALFDLSQKKQEDGINSAITELDLESDRKAIAEQEAVVEKLRAKAQASEVTARYTGIITAVNCIAGDKANAGTDLASLDIEGKGFSLSFSVTNQQAQRVRIGETASVSYRWGDPVIATLTAIRADPQSQGRSKILEFSIDGAVNVGETLSLTVGERDQSYDCVLPNSAIRQDADGTFILVAETKSTPLGNRYVAKRLEVIVIAKDEVNTAISRDGYDYEFVITTATKPVEPGTQVRLTGR